MNPSHRSLTDIVCLMSGGLDSSVAATLLLQETQADLWPVYIMRGAGAEKFEKKALREILKWLRFQYPQRIHSLKLLRCQYPPLNLKSAYPKPIQDRHGYVGREIILSNLAAFYALTLPKKPKQKLGIATGSLDRDLFPHNSPAYWSKAQELLDLSLGKSAPRILNPLQKEFSPGAVDKKKAVHIAHKMGLPLNSTRSCISSTPVPCLQCIECKQRVSAEKSWARSTSKSFYV